MIVPSEQTGHHCGKPSLPPRSEVFGILACSLFCRASEQNMTSIPAWLVQCTVSSTSAMPCPPPMQSVTRPRLRPSRRIEWISFVVSIAPVAPIGWP